MERVNEKIYKCPLCDHEALFWHENFKGDSYSIICFYCNRLFWTNHLYEGFTHGVCLDTPEKYSYLSDMDVFNLNNNMGYDPVKNFLEKITDPYAA